ncbi:MAG: sugar transferase [Pirellulales bacterium]|nr:sugar transferase [Pirellulales bacterium]
MLKRLFDIFVSGIGLLVFSPLLAALAVWIKRDSPGPVFYRGWRAGRYGKPFQIYKFRSMVTNADQIGGPTTSGDDPRVTRSGRFVRRFKLDELSQLINVFRGDMSLVGPRPEVVDKAEQFDEEARKTLSIRPGITDWASIWNSDEGGVLAGTADPDAVYQQVIFPTKLKLQLYYLDHHGFFGDIKIIFYTLLRILRKSWRPKELKDYPTFEQLRAEAEKFIAPESSLK